MISHLDGGAVPALGKAGYPPYNGITKTNSRSSVMKKLLILTLISVPQLFLMTPVFAQAFGEYGRAVGGLPQGVGPRASGSGPAVGSGTGEIGSLGGKALPIRLVVATKEAGLYPKQDDESEKLGELTQGESLVPMGQSSGGND